MIKIVVTIQDEKHGYTITMEAGDTIQIAINGSLVPRTLYEVGTGYGASASFQYREFKE